MKSHSSETDKILYWKEVIASPELLAKYQTVIDKLRSGDYLAADLDLKVKSHPRVYGIKINDKERLLFTTVEIEGVAYAYILEELLDHKYENCHSMQPGAVDKILNSSEAQEIIADYLEKQQEKNIVVETKKPNNTNNRRGYKVEYLELDFVDSKWLQLDNTQRMVLSHPLPFICNGTPGSGKSTLSLLVIAKAIDGGYKDIIYITQSLALKNDMEKNWNNSPYSKNLPPNVVVRFATYTELLQEAYPNKTLVNDENCLDWIGKYISTHKKVYAMPEAPADFFSPASIYAELRIACGYSEDDYYKLGARQCNLGGYSDAKKIIWKMLQAYIKHLDRENCMHAAFTSLPDLGVSMVAIDEGQDFATQQLSVICNQTEHASICIFYDSDQSLLDQISKEEYLQSCLYNRTFQRIEPLKLQFSYRSAAAIVRVANQTLKIRNYLYDGRVNADQKHEIKNEPTDTREGSAEWPPYYDPKGTDKKKSEIGKELIEQLKKRTKSTQCAVITTERLVASAREIFDTESVFTVPELKGLQYPEIIIFGLLANPEDQVYLREANKHISTLTEESKLNLNLSKDRSSKSNPIWMLFYTAIMRGINYICVVEEKTRNIDYIAKYHMKEMSDKFSEKKPVEKTSKADWEKHAAKLKDNGIIDQACNIEKKIMDKAPSTPKKKITKSKKKAQKKQPPITVPITTVQQYYPIEFDCNDVNQSEVKYLNYLMVNFNEKDLMGFFSHKQALKLLMSIPFMLEFDKDVFMQALPELELEKKRKDEIMSHNKDITKISMRGKKSLFFHILHSKEHTRQFYLYLRKYLLLDKSFIFLPKTRDKVLLILNDRIHKTSEKITADRVFSQLIVHAAKLDQPDFLKYMIDEGYIDPRDFYSDGFNILQVAVVAGSEYVTSYLANKKILDLENTGHADSYKTPLYLAALNGNKNIVLTLLMEGANINGNDKNYIRTPVMAAIQNSHDEITRMLIVRDVLYPIVAGVRFTLDTLKKYKRTNIMEVLENQLAIDPAALNAIKFDNNQILDKELNYLNALHENFIKTNVIKMLSNRSAIKWLAGFKFKDGHTLFQLINNNNDHAQKLLDGLCSENESGMKYIFSILPDKLSDYMLVSNDGNFILTGEQFLRGDGGLISMAIMHDHATFLLLMVTTIVSDFSKIYLSGLNMLQFAAFCGSKKVSEMLIQLVKIDGTGIADSFQTPLYMASLNGHEEVVKLLIEEGANAHGKDERGIKTPLMAAIQGGHLQIIEILMNKGAKLHPRFTNMASIMAVRNDDAPDIMNWLEIEESKSQENNIPKKVTLSLAPTLFHAGSVIPDGERKEEKEEKEEKFAPF